ncbi:MAG: DNA endonuclease SmrA [Gammaproteobacteria bacterium]|nr:DNA endonuclease SmrA [Gammaproteobacteria bacterium]
MKDGREPSTSDAAALFREAMQDVKPLQKSAPLNPAVQDRVHGPPSEAQLRARSAALGEKKPEAPDYLTLGEVPIVAPRDFVAWRREGVQELVTDRLRKGHYVPADSLDLHGEKVRRARDMVHDFLVGSLSHGHRCVRIVHGRGEQSPDPARLKRYVTAWLQVHPLVNAFVSATPLMGYTGAVFVLLRKSKEAKAHNRELHGGGSPDDET